MNKDYKQNPLMRAIALLASVALGWLSCSEPIDGVLPDGFRLEVQNVSATYDGAQGRVQLSWTRPSGDFDHYRLYRAVMADTMVIPDTSRFESTLGRAYIPATAASFTDVPEPAEGVYYYYIVAVRLDDYGVPVEGVKSPIDAAGVSAPVRVYVGNDVVLSVNHGDEFTIDTAVVLVLRDRDHQVASVRVTQMTTDTGSAATAADPRDQYTQLRDLAATGFFGSSSTVTRAPVPDFGRSDVHNATRSFVPRADTIATVVGWNLSQGSGKKSVWVEITYRDGRVDTLYDFIKTQPHKVDVVLRHSAGGLYASRFDTTEVDGSSTIKSSVFYTSTFVYSVKVFGDSTIDTLFDVWYMTGKEYERLTGSSFLGRGWIMTKPREEGLVGKGTRHNPDQLYQYSLDLGVPSASENLSWTLGGKTLTIDSVRTSVATNRRLMDSLKTDPSWKTARKQFVLVFRFRELYFGGTFLYVYGVEGAVENIRTSRDCYLPHLKFNNTPSVNPDHLADGSSLAGPFNFALDTMSVTDVGYATVTDVRLVISKLPAGFVWNPAVTPKTLTVDSLIKFSNDVIPFAIEKPDVTVKRVRWDNIDPRGWTTGYYLMAVVVSDDKGNTGFAGVQSPSTSPTFVNPFRVFISTSN